MKTINFLILKITLFLSLICAVNIQAQSQYKLDKSFPIANRGAAIFDVAEDSTGNMYVVGMSRSTGVYNSNPSTTVSMGKAFILKINSLGNIAWVKYMGGHGSSAANSISLGPDGHLVIGGDLDSGIISTNISGLQNYTNAGPNDNFIMKLDTSGSLIWFKVFVGSGTVYNESSFGQLAIGGNGDVYATGSFSGQVDFDPGPASFYRYSAGSSFFADIFLVKITSSGNLRWVKAVGEAYHDFGISLVLDEQENVFIGGMFSDTVDFNPSAGGGVVSSTSHPGIPVGVRPTQDCFIAKYDSSGSFSWVKGFGGKWEDRLSDLEIDDAGNLYSTGWFVDTADIDPGPSSHLVYASGGRGSDAYIHKLDSSGNLIWVKTYGSIRSNDGLEGLAVGSAGHVFTTGAFVESVTFDASLGNVYSGDTSNPFTVTGLIELDGNGQFVWAQPLQSNFVVGLGVGYRYSGEPYIFGVCSDGMDIDPTMKNEHLVTSSQGTNSFFYQLRLCSGTLDTIVDTACNYVVFRDSIFSESGIYTFPLLTNSGCDSIIVLDLTIDSLNTRIRFRDSTTFEAEEMGATYVWYNCTKATYLNNETSRYFSPPNKDKYAVLIRRDGCSRLSNCMSLAEISIPVAEKSIFKLYPNPVNDKLVISSEEFVGLRVNIELYTANGALVKDYGKLLLADHQHTLEVSHLQKGTYLLKLTKGGYPEYFKIVKN